ncbi:Hypp1285 [Branchiostoma lanceolatum]|uniref:Hypp1285 protein n=1 Tax=Branchiostoma lanceolatum TaxID=7740 RepID=A0A8J9ZJ70_BRALA|nr:Hypp1285 [Branchiostoma lanceolatum]
MGDSLFLCLWLATMTAALNQSESVTNTTAPGVGSSSPTQGISTQEAPIQENQVEKLPTLPPLTEEQIKQMIIKKNDILGDPPIYVTLPIILVLVVYVPVFSVLILCEIRVQRAMRVHPAAQKWGNALGVPTPDWNDRAQWGRMAPVPDWNSIDIY